MAEERDWIDRLVLPGQTEFPGDPRYPTDEESLDLHPQPIDFVAYTSTTLINATFELVHDRLTDALNAGHAFRLRRVQTTILDSMASASYEQLAIPRDDLLLVQATGPRGNAKRRFRGWRHEVRLAMGPLQVQGWIHTVPGAHPTLGVYHRQPMVPITDAEISYMLLGRPIVLRAETVIVNRDAVTSIRLSDNGTADQLRAAFPYLDLAIAMAPNEVHLTRSPRPLEPGEERTIVLIDEPEEPAPPSGGLRVGSRTPAYLARPPRRR